MFKTLHLKGLAQSPRYGYAAELAFFKGRRTVEFKPGLNVMFAPNGSGKSTVLSMLGESMCALQGGISALTENAVHEGIDMMVALRNPRTGEKKPMRDKFGLHVEHDGQPVLYGDPRKSVGLMGGAFDDDFFEQGITNVLAQGRASSGQNALRKMAPLLAVLKGDAAFPTEIRRTIHAKNVNDLWQQALALLEKRLAPSIERGQPSLLLDEPESGFSLVWQSRLWRALTQPGVAERCQVIVASHSPFALGHPGVNYIDLEPGFREEAEAALRAQFGR